LRDLELTRSQLEQLETFKHLLEGRKFKKGDIAFEETIEWVRNFPQSLKIFEREHIRQLVCESFTLTQEELDAEIARGIKPMSNGKAQTHLNKSALVLEHELDGLLPTGGYLRKYVEYTSHSEAPLAYHVFSALCTIGATLNRRVWFDMGYYRLYPTLGIIILGPSGIKKTSAANIAIDILQRVGLVKIYSEKLTPEALIDAMRGDNATGVIYAPEMTVFLNKQRYNEGLVQIITRFMDCPDYWKSETVGRGERVVKNVAISSLMCSTLDWFIRSTPEDSFGGGFIARNLLIVQEASARCEPIPLPGDESIRAGLISHLASVHEFEGEVTLDKLSYARYIDWYSTEHQEVIKKPEHAMLSTYYNRKPDHIKRIAICLHMIEHKDFLICYECFDRALRLINWTEQFLPAMLEQMFKSQTGEAQEQILRLIRNSTKLSHSDLIRKIGYRMSAPEAKTVIGSLKEARLIQEHIDNIGHYYTILEEK